MRTMAVSRSATRLRSIRTPAGWIRSRCEPHHERAREVEGQLAAVQKKRDVTAALREAIIGGQFMPGERLIEVELAARLTTNRVQIRAALSKLEGEGLVVSEPN